MKIEGLLHYYPQDVAGLAKTLRLSSTQILRVRDVVERTRRRIDDLMTLPGADGKSPNQLLKEQRRRVKRSIADTSASGFYTIALATGEWRKWKMPGRNTTYADELARIHAEGREETERELTHKQRKRFADADTSALLGDPNSAGMSIAYLSTVTRIDPQLGSTGR